MGTAKTHEMLSFTLYNTQLIFSGYNLTQFMLMKAEKMRYLTFNILRDLEIYSDVKVVYL